MRFLHIGIGIRKCKAFTSGQSSLAPARGSISKCIFFASEAVVLISKSISLPSSCASVGHQYLEDKLGLLFFITFDLLEV